MNSSKTLPYSNISPSNLEESADIEDGETQTFDESFLTGTPSQDVNDVSYNNSDTFSKLINFFSLTFKKEEDEEGYANLDMLLKVKVNYCR